MKYDANRDELLSQGYKVTRVPMAKVAKDVDKRTNPRDNTFDQSYKKGILPKWIRTWRASNIDEDDGIGMRPTLVPQPYNGLTREEMTNIGGAPRPVAEMPYTDALGEFFDTHLALWPATKGEREYVHTTMYDRRTTREIGAANGTSHAAVVQGRKRAVEKFIAYMGGKEALAEKLRQYLADKEGQDGISRLHYLPRWVRG